MEAADRLDFIRVEQVNGHDSIVTRIGLAGRRAWSSQRERTPATPPLRRAVERLYHRTRRCLPDPRRDELLLGGRHHRPERAERRQQLGRPIGPDLSTTAVY